MTNDRRPQLKSHSSFQCSEEFAFARSLDWLVMLAGEAPRKDEVLVAFQDCSKILAVDGGASTLLKMGITPDIAIGDFDSILKTDLKRLQDTKVPLLTFSSDKDFTDLELGLEFLLDIEANTVRILGASDGNPDHHLANYLAISAERFRGINLEILNPPFRSFMAWEGLPITIRGTPGDTISIIPLSDTVEIHHFSGVKWPINNLTVARGEGRTLRNQLETDSANLLTSKGKSIVVHKFL